MLGPFACMTPTVLSGSVLPSLSRISTACPNTGSPQSTNLATCPAKLFSLIGSAIFSLDSLSPSTISNEISLLTSPKHIASEHSAMP